MSSTTGGRAYKLFTDQWQAFNHWRTSRDRTRLCGSSCWLWSIFSPRPTTQRRVWRRRSGWPIVRLVQHGTARRHPGQVVDTTPCRWPSTHAMAHSIGVSLTVSVIGCQTEICRKH